MKRVPLQVISRLLVAAGAGLGFGCGRSPEPVTGPNFGKAATGPTVTASLPAYGYEGEVSKQVAITGSGFAIGAAASWERNGSPDPKIQVVSTQYLSPTQVVATVNIAPDAALTFYDLAVTNPDRKKGIGYRLFEVTRAIVVDSVANFRAANGGGGLVGVYFPKANKPQLARFWSQSTGLVTLPGSGTSAWAIDEAGETITGNASGGTGGFIPIWTKSGSGWVMGTLPIGPGSAGGNGRAIASDPVTGLARYVAGIEERSARVWRRGTSGWERVVLPSLTSPANDVVQGVSRTGVVVGFSAAHATVWEPDGQGGYTATALPGTANYANGINGAGDLIVGSYNQTGGAFYWVRLPGGGWSAPQSLPIACGAAIDVDDLGRIAANDCPRSGQNVAPAVFLPPYTGAPIWLGTLGGNGTLRVEGMSRTGGWLAGANVYWHID